ncbi:MAG: aspartate/glutamate racemase family protein [Beijerinckiaceae bacterium]
MKLLVINPNTTEAITEKIARAARSALPGVDIVAATGRFGASYIASRASYAIASHAALDCLAEHGAGCNAVLLACFGDPGLDAIREVTPVPVISLIDASCAEAGMDGRKFSIVTGGERWGTMLQEMIQLRGLDGQLASIRTVAPSGSAIAADPESAYALLVETCLRCINEDGAQAVILGGAGLLGIAKKIQAHVSEPLICSNEAGFRAAYRALAISGRQTGIEGCDPVNSTALSPSLTTVLRNGFLRNAL